MIENQSNKENSSPERVKFKNEAEKELIKILSAIIHIRKTLYIAVGIGTILGIIIALSIPYQYTVKVTLSPEMGSAQNNNGLAGIAASFLGSGNTMGDGVEALNVSLSSYIVSSTPFLMELLSMNISIDKENDVISLKTYLDKQSYPWWNYVISFPSMIINGMKKIFGSEEKLANIEKQGVIELTNEENRKINFLRKNIVADIDKKTAITSVFVTLQNPKVAAVVADSVVHKLQEYIIRYRICKAIEDCTYLEKLFIERQQEYYVAQKRYADYVDTHDNLILQSVRTEQERLQNNMNLAYQVYSQVANQLQVSRAKVQEEKPVFAIVEPAVTPLQPSGLGLKAYVLLCIFLSICLTSGWLLYGRMFLENLKKELKKDRD